MAMRRGLDFLRVNEKRHVACSSKWYHTPLPNDCVKLLKNLRHQVHDESLTFKKFARSSIRAPPRVLPSYFEATSRGTWYHRARRAPVGRNPQTAAAPVGRKNEALFDVKNAQIFFRPRPTGAEAPTARALRARGAYGAAPYGRIRTTTKIPLLKPGA